MAESPKNIEENASIQQQNFSPVPFSLVHSDFSSQFVTKDTSEHYEMQEAEEIKKNLESCHPSAALPLEDSTSMMEVSTNYSPVDVPESNELSLELSKMSVKENSPINMSCTNDSALSHNMSPEKKGEQLVAQEKLEQPLEISIEE